MKFFASLISFTLIIGLTAASAGHPSDSLKIRVGYIDSLNRVITIFKENNIPSIALTEYSIPESSVEANLFFQLDYKKESSVEFRKLLQHVNSICLEGRQTTLKRFISLSQFVDGYFAEDYFDSAKLICERKPKAFCRAFKNLTFNKKQRLIDYGIDCKRN